MRFALLLPLLLASAAAPATLAAQDIPPPPPIRAPAPPAEPGVTMIHAGTLMDRPGRAPRRNVTIMVRDGLIQSVQDGFTTAPVGARVIDLRDRFVLPGPDRQPRPPRQRPRRQ
jgi:hypothetical protein